MRAVFGLPRSISALLGVAILMAVLLPAFSAAQRAQSAPWLVICSSHNPLTTAASRASSPAGEDDVVGAHCPLCCLNPIALAPPPAPGSPVAPDTLGIGPPPRFLHAGQPLFAWAARYSRGPPVFS